MKHRVAMVCESPLLAAGLEAALTQDASLELVAAAAAPPPDLLIAEATDSAEIVTLAQQMGRERIPLLLLGDGLHALAARLVAEQRPVALLSRSVTPARLRAAIVAVLAGLQVHEADALPSRALTPLHGEEPPGEPLTPRELEVFELVAKGLSNPDIAAALGISAHTAKFHVGQILAKIGAATRAEAVSLGLRMGLIGV